MKKSEQLLEFATPLAVRNGPFGKSFNQVKGTEPMAIPQSGRKGMQNEYLMLYFSIGNYIV